MRRTMSDLIHYADKLDAAYSRIEFLEYLLKVATDDAMKKPNPSQVLRERVAATLLRSDTGRCWNSGCANVSYWRYASEEQCRANV